jgi:hypothetical protein
MTLRARTLRPLSLQGMCSLIKGIHRQGNADMYIHNVRSVTLDVQVSNVQVVEKSSLNFNDRSVGYPDSCMPFYLYGTKNEQHIRHLIAFDPNIQLCASEVSLGLDKSSRLTIRSED